MISLEEIKEKQKELNKMIEEYNKQYLKWDKNWKPKEDDKYYFIDIYNEVDFEFYEDSSDEKIITHNRVFQTEEQAEKWLEIDEYLKEKSFEPDWNDEEQMKLSLGYNYKDKIFIEEISYIYSNFPKYYFRQTDVFNEILEKYTTEELEFYFNIGE